MPGWRCERPGATARGKAITDPGATDRGLARRGRAMNALLTAVLDFARRDLHLFPLHYIIDRLGQPCCSCGNQECGSSAGKHPYPRLARRGLLNATTDVATLNRWWGADVPYNIGIRTGAAS
jgi:hypothetical protein